MKERCPACNGPVQERQYDGHDPCSCEQATLCECIECGLDWLSDEEPEVLDD